MDLKMDNKQMEPMLIDSNNNRGKTQKISKFRRFLPQVSSPSLLLRKFRHNKKNRKKIILECFHLQQFFSINLDLFTNFQVLKTMARNIIRLNTGLVEGFPSIVIPSLICLSRELNPGEVLVISPSQALWIGKFKEETL